MYTHKDAGTILAVNAELEKIEQEFKDVVSRLPDGNRTMEADFDMNSNRILNLPKPVQGTEPVRLQDILDGIQITTSPDLGLIRATVAPTQSDGALWFDKERALYVGDDGQWKLVGGEVERKFAVLDSVQALRTTVLPDEVSVVQTVSYYADRIVGGGTYRLSTDTTSADNGGTMIIDTLGRRWRLLHNGTVSIRQFGMVPDWNGTTGTNNLPALQAMFDDVNIHKITGWDGPFYFGQIPANTSGALIQRDIVIDWLGAQLFVRHLATNNISTAFIEARNTKNFDMSNFEFTDVNYSHLDVPANNRGIHPFVLSATAGNGITDVSHRAGNYIVHKGQSVYCNSALTGDDLGVNYTKGFTLYGEVYGADVYYGGIHYYSGSCAKGAFRLGRYVRQLIANDAYGIHMDIRTEGENVATSASLLMTAHGTIPMKDIRIRSHNKYLNGPMRISAPDDVGSAALFKDVDLDVVVENIGANIDPVNGALVAISAYDAVGTYLEVGTLTVTDCKIKIRTPLLNLSQPFFFQTRSPNVKRITLDVPRLDVTSLQAENTIIRTTQGTVIGKRGNIVASPLTFRIQDIIDGNDVSPRSFYIEMDVVRFVSGDPTKYNIEKFGVWASTSSLGANIITRVTNLFTLNPDFANPTVITLAPFGAASFSITSTTAGTVNDRIIVTMRDLASFSRM
jgi:hypothetical protein